MCDRILLVDDEPNLLTSYKDFLQRQYSIDTALDGERALELVRGHGPYAVIVSDMNMPGMSGVDLLTEAQRIAPDTVRIMLTGDSEQQTAMLAINQGHIFQFLTKPCLPRSLLSTLQNGVKHHQLIIAERQLLEHTLNGSIKMLADILSIVEPEAFGQGQKMREDIRLLAGFLKISPTWELEMAAMLCRIGFVTIPPKVIERSRVGATLSTVETSLLMRAPEFGRDLLKNIPRLEPVAQSIYYQNKNFDGTGFPKDELEGEKIPFGGRILKVLTEMVELESKGIHKIQALMQMKRSPGRYDPKLLEAALSCLLLEKKGRAVKFTDLCLGDVLLSAIETVEGMLIVPAGNKISPMLLSKLNNFTELSGIKEPIFVEGPSNQEAGPKSA
jgi:response regulator RpfG family c-di-GMP phosphodiesterase